MKYTTILKLKKIAGIIARNSLWILPIIAAIAIVSQSAIIETLLAIVIFEAVAIGITTISAFFFYQSDTLKYQMWNALGSIFLGVHICIGLIVMGVYFTQF